MRVTVFTTPGWYAFTPDESGANLPADMGTWNKFKIFNMHRGETPRIAVSSDRVLDGIEADGYYLQSTKQPDA